ncbi:hypothetical protein ES703_102870 [subsurface metagenome]
MKSDSNWYIIASVIITILVIFLPIYPTRSAQEEKTWHYVIIGSSIKTYGWTEYYGDYIETDLGVTIVSHSYYVVSQRASGLLKNLRNKEELMNDIMNAEVITIGVGFADMKQAILIYGAGGSNQPHRINEELKTFRETYDAIPTEILSLRSPNTIIRVMDFYCPYVQSHKDYGIYEDTKRYWMEFNKCIVEVAEKHGIPVAQVFQAMNGPHGEDDPNAQGYLSFDGKHLSDKGFQVVANLFRELGYG